ncbi:hypothetical protein T4E_10656 [Trichinella pseudospiralis]|uniref:Uncharacterized protein n=1 Tax=Trichinella pseudospiralis TaxID=6337 RepID=A0A0V0XI07_TRIPS|nr:hypothetical protein T4E_10656 [Trichinella pseudospiralis]
MEELKALFCFAYAQSNDHVFATSGQCATISFCASSTTDGIYLAPLDMVGSDNSSTVVSLLLPRCGVTALFVRRSNSLMLVIKASKSML